MHNVQSLEVLLIPSTNHQLYLFQVVALAQYENIHREQHNNSVTGPQSTVTSESPISGMVEFNDISAQLR